MKTKIIPLFVIILLCCSGCATPNFPARKGSFFQNNRQIHQVCLFPFKLRVSTLITKLNTYEQLYAMKNGLEESFLIALKEELNSMGYPVTVYISADDIKEKKIKEPELTVINELFNELSSADYCIHKNISKEQRKLPDYSIGLRAKELKELLNNKADTILFIYPGGFIQNLGATKAGMVAANAIMTIGMSLLMPTPEDIIAITVILVDMDTGDIVWYNQGYYTGKSLLLSSHIKSALNNIFSDLSVKDTY